jgi:hypothetical protein
MALRIINPGQYNHEKTDAWLSHWSALFMRKNQCKMILFFILTAIPLTGALAGCANPGTLAYSMAPVGELPDEVKAAPPVVLEAYQFAVANPEILEQLPCYCGCGDMGHTSNYACYVQEQADNGELIFDNHALGCSICVDITQDAMRLLQEGKTLPEIRAYVDDTYAQYGPSNIPGE